MTFLMKRSITCVWFPRAEEFSRLEQDHTGLFLSVT